MKYAAGIDLGGTFVKYALVSETGKLLIDGKLPVGGKATREDTLEAIEVSIQKVMDKAAEESLEVSGIGIGSPGIVCDGIVHGGADNLDRWENIDLAKIFGDKFNLPVLADNDANVMGLGEATYGAAKGCSDVIFITVGTGIGGAIVANGELYGGFKNRGTEMGHVTIDHKGIDCNCGGRGCLEAYASTSALIQQYADKTGQDVETITGHYIVEKYKASEDAAVECMQEHCDYLGHGIAGFINTFAPQKVVIGGGISEAGQFYIDMIKKSALGYAMSDCSTNTDVVAATLGNNAGCLGAASLIFKTINS
ncbi:ROK family protein [Prolixibacteraceae bacterium Z1-6]|uniref:ROK family protein n=1 Tax=Draconibacterium aestuarii TaxID=2998507 RepID=A0A9X3J9W0_9BACT|nr:ROK family protein [Prolixibacteraceae bacterium Z1-6]